jgi:Fe-S cluster assembly protein SufD
MRTASAEQTFAPYRTAFASVQTRGDGSEAQRAAAYSRFEALGFPPEREEDWKYTSLRRLAARQFDLAHQEATLPAELPLPAALARHRLVLINGRLRHDLSSADALPPGLRVRSLAEAIRAGEGHASLLRVPVGGGTERFAALNAALCPDALIIDIDDGAKIEDAIHIVVVASGDTPTMTHPRLILRSARGSVARIILHHSGAEGIEHFVNGYVDAELGPDALLQLHRLQMPGRKTFHIERIDATIGPRGRFVMHDAQLGGSIGRLDLNARLAAPGAATELTGLFLADGTQHFDTQIRVDHLAPGARSLQDYRGIAAGRGRAVFNSKVVVHEGAQKSDARQVSRNLLLSKGAEIDTKPELEIYADDVKCSHGATTGQLDPAAMFYLRSRGLSEGEARSALTRAFTGAVLSRMDHEASAQFVHEQLDARLAGLLEEPA